MPITFRLPVNNPARIRSLFTLLIKIYGIADLTSERKEFLDSLISKFGYIPYPHYKALNELSEGDIVYSLLRILQYQGTVDENAQIANYTNPSILERSNIKTSDWFRKEGQNIKLMSLSALGNGNKSTEPARFIDWLCQLICLPKGNLDLGVLADTIYLLPFHPREFGCAYLPSSSEIAPCMLDKRIEKFLGLSAKEQVMFFITLSQLAGHPVIYDILPQTARFSKIVLANPYVARWSNIKELMELYTTEAQRASNEIKASGAYNLNIVNSVLDKYIKNLNGEELSYSEDEMPVFNLMEIYMKEVKKGTAKRISLKRSQEEFADAAYKIICNINGRKVQKEEDITLQGETISALIKNGLWTMPGGAWCSSGVPVFDRMSKNQEYPIYKHYDYLGEDVSKFANLDCQTPYYFAYLENGKLNDKVVDFYVKYTSNLQKEYNFDGFRVDHIDHVCDKLSEVDGLPISYRIPAKVLGEVNSNLKKKVPYFATLAEYMLWDDLYKEYHQDMHFDILWGNDIISQSSKTPKTIIEDNKTLEDYNLKQKGSMLSFLKTYNNQDGEFEAIDRYPGQLTDKGALFKWFKYKFLPGGSWAMRPMLYVDGDESYTEKGIEHVIGNEESMVRGTNYDFYEKFNAINFFSQHSNILTSGKAKLLIENENGLAAWEVNSSFGSLLVIANYKYPKEKTEFKNENGDTWIDWSYGEAIYDSKILLQGRSLKSYYEFERDDEGLLKFVEIPLQNYISNEIIMHELKPAEFKVYGYND